MKIISALVVYLVAIILTACGGGGGGNSGGGNSGGGNSGGGNSGGGTTSYTIGGTISGLLTGASLIITNNGNDSLTIASNGSYQFSSKVLSGANYSVVITSQPVGQTCSVANKSGVGYGITSNVSTITVVCSTNSYSVGGTVSGLTLGKSLVITNNGNDSLTIASNGSFTFTNPVAFGGSYATQITGQPSGLICSSTGSGSGANVGSNISNIQVTCYAVTSIGVACNNNANASVVPSSYIFPSINVGSSENKSVTISNTGGCPLTFYTAPTTISYNGNSNIFTMANNNCPPMLDVNQSCSVVVSFNPVSASTFSGNVSFLFNELSNSIYTTLTGVGVSSNNPQANLSASTFDFGGNPVNTTSTTSISITNTGNVPLTFNFGPSAISYTGAGSVFRVVSTTCSATLQVGSSCTSIVGFTPLSNLTYSGNISFGFNEIGSLLSTALSGSGTGGATPSILLSSTSFDFGVNSVGSVYSQIFTVTNNGTQALTFGIAPVALSYNSNGKVFTVTQTNCGATLQVSTSCTATVQFEPLSNILYTGNITFVFQELLSGSGVISLSGTGK